MSTAGVLATLHHPKWGACELVRVEGTDWIVRLLSNGKLYRFPPSTRGQFTRTSPIEPAVSSSTQKAASTIRGLATVRHADFGLGELLRIEVADWIVTFDSNGRTYRYPPAVHGKLTVIDDRTPLKTFTRLTVVDPNTTQEEVASAEQTIIVSEPPLEPPTERSVAPSERHRAFRVIESLRNGLPPTHIETRHLAVGFERISKDLKNLFHDVAVDGGRAMVIKGAYGQGKTFCLKLLEEMALEANFVVLRTEIDATENRLNKPHHIYHDLIAHLRLPGVNGNQLRTLALKARARVEEATASISDAYRKAWAAVEILARDTGCPPLAWLVSDPHVADKPELLGLLSCDPGCHIPTARSMHRIRGGPRDWPVFNAGTQGDFASYLLSGIGRLAKTIGYKGLIIIMDEMEKWQDLNWKEQSQAGNLLGGLIWGATAERGKRTKQDEPLAITHSLRSGGYPFTTYERNHVGIAVAMTPRGYESPEDLWQQYGLLEMVYLPELTEHGLLAYCTKLAPIYATAFGLESPANGQLAPIAKRAVTAWKRRGEFTTRFGIQSAIASFDAWRENLQQT